MTAFLTSRRSRRYSRFVMGGIDSDLKGSQSREARKSKFLYPILNRRFAAIREFPLARYVKHIAPKYDLMISGYNIMDFGRLFFSGKIHDRNLGCL
jgi:hypothetical protein